MVAAACLNAADNTAQFREVAGVLITRMVMAGGNHAAGNTQSKETAMLGFTATHPKQRNVMVGVDGDEGKANNEYTEDDAEPQTLSPRREMAAIDEYVATGDWDDDGSEGGWVVAEAIEIYRRNSPY